MTDAKYYQLAMRIFADFSVSIALPSVLGALLGKWIDAQKGTQPLFLIICLFLAFILTALLIVKKAKYYNQIYKNLIDKEENKD